MEWPILQCKCPEVSHLNSKGPTHLSPELGHRMASVGTTPPAPCSQGTPKQRWCSYEPAMTLAPASATACSSLRGNSTLFAHVVHRVGVVLIARYSVEAGVEVRVRGQHSLYSCAGPRQPAGRRQTAVDLQVQVALSEDRDNGGLDRDIVEGLLSVRKHRGPCEPAAHHVAQQQATEQRLHPSLNLLNEPRLDHSGSHDRSRL
ncbi:hypothetical protein HaLaN_07157 [Haematococcus lacustris]|uniref:Uncharacterized protein n=1 Tax=Haematococcus lacustris TaxID=44745 RepID=A0A699YX90_HAELA|nr:hypothetical protein HaLaN_07157 [Haematococcus lacustris]